MKRLALAVLLLCACSHFSGRDFPGTYRREGKVPDVAPECGAFSHVNVRDPRPEPQLVGDRSRQDKAGSFPITMVGDVGSWMRDGIEAQAKEARFAVGDSKAPVINVTINTVDMHENVGSNADYRARVVFDVAVVLADGRTCLTTSFEGDGKNFGSAGSPINYAQTLNRALDAATFTMFGLPAMRDAACGKCP
jgi:hypothetical protein